MWQEEREELNRVKEVKEELADARRQVEIARSKGDFDKAGELLHSTIPKLEHQLHDLEGADERASGHSKKKKKLLAEAVTADAISTIVARQTGGIPVSRITGSESKELLKMEEKLRERVVGQDHALEAVSNCVRLARTRLQAQDRTLGNFCSWDRPVLEVSSV